MTAPRNPAAAGRTGRMALGLDFGTESVRVLLVDLEGNERGAAVARYAHGQITEGLPSTGRKLAPHTALQHPRDWLDSAARAVRRALRAAGAGPDAVAGIGVDFTSCTMLPARRDGTPLCLLDRYAANPHAWPKLWKHHGAQAQADRINAVARRRREPWLARYGGAIGLEWFFPKVLETLEHAPAVWEAADIFVEAGDWLVWQLVGGPAAELPRSTCQAGYKAMWSRRDGYPSRSFFAAVHPDLAGVVKDRLPGRHLSPGECAGGLRAAAARRLGLPEGVPVSAATIDAHAGVPGAGVSGPGTMVLVMGTSSCHMLNATVERPVPGVAGIVEGGILPGLFGYETGQAAVGDAFAWFRHLVGHEGFDVLSREAAALPPGAGDVLCMDWLNGCRTPLMDGELRGAFTGLSLAHGPAHLYRALLEASACGLRWIVELLEAAGVPVNGFVATGGLPHTNPLLVQVCADVLGRTITVHPCGHGPALGAAILGALAAGPERTGFESTRAAIAAMSAKHLPGCTQVRPVRARRGVYEALYRRYRELAELLRVMRRR